METCLNSESLGMLESDGNITTCLVEGGGQLDGVASSTFYKAPEWEKINERT